MVLIFDTIHGYIPWNNKMTRYIDNRWVKRLKRIKQLGLLEHVFPCASHNRFEHSVGVAYLGEKYCNILNSNGYNKQISEKEINCIKLAGLFHDLGHGPFSHVFDNVVLKNCCKCDDILHHEIRSRNIVEKIFKEIGDDDYFNGYDIDLIKDMIERDNSVISVRNDAKMNIINNKINGIDVDKFDYLLRDPKHIGLDYSFDSSRIMLKTGLYNGNLIYEMSLAENIYDMFYTRYKFHKDIYNHKTVKIIELMIGDSLVKANDKYNFCDIVKSDDFLKLDDSIYSNILFSDDKDMMKSRDLLQRIENRNLYKQIYSSKVDSLKDFSQNQFIEDLFPDYNLDDLRIINMTLNMCNGKKNPLEYINFMRKDGTIEEGKGLGISKFDISCFEENRIIVYDIKK
uniref:HD domain-containing protein n=1 Tax=viral metagenome TaxID=1070528 RepID=A0A6C0JC06_9ZZZZ